MGNDKGDYLDHAYGLETAEDTRRLYAGWAETYEAETAANGYVSPARCAAALAGAVDDLSAPLLDLGCGTGLSGVAFRAAGFTTIDGTDFSPEMLALAEAKAGVYRRLIPGDVTRPLPGAAGDYAQIAAVGVFSPAHAPPAMVDRAVAHLPPGGHFVFTLNDHALAEPGYQARVRALEAGGTAEVVFSEYGDHLPKRDLKALVTVLRRL